MREGLKLGQHHEHKIVVVLGHMDFYSYLANVRIHRMIPAVQKLIAVLELEGVVATADAKHCCFDALPDFRIAA